MLKQIIQVAEFMQLMGQETKLVPVSVIDKDTVKLREKLSQEELDEMKDGLKIISRSHYEVDPALILDALGDRFYVWAGDAVAYGLANYLPEAFRIIHESNMSKLWTEEELDTIKTKRPADTVYDIQQLPNGLYVVKNSDGKVMKSPGYKPALPQLRALVDPAVTGQETLDFDTPPPVKVYEEATGDVCNPCTCGSNSPWCQDHADTCDARVPF